MPCHSPCCCGLVRILKQMSHTSPWTIWRSIRADKRYLLNCDVLTTRNDTQYGSLFSTWQ
jgi:hypothetical protein